MCRLVAQNQLLFVKGTVNCFRVEKGVVKEGARRVNVCYIIIIIIIIIMGTAVAQ